MAGRAYQSSGKKSADATIKATAGIVHAVTINTDKTNDANVKLYDGGSGGTLKWEGQCPGADDCKHFGGIDMDFSTDIYLDITGTGAYCYIAYQ